MYVIILRGIIASINFIRSQQGKGLLSILPPWLTYLKVREGDENCGIAHPLIVLTSTAEVLRSEVYVHLVFPCRRQQVL
jgi:hypothetical protein